MDHILHQYSESKSRNEVGQEEEEVDDDEPESQLSLNRKFQDRVKSASEQDDKVMFRLNFLQRCKFANLFSNKLGRNVTFVLTVYSNLHLTIGRSDN